MVKYYRSNEAHREAMTSNSSVLNHMPAKATRWTWSQCNASYNTAVCCLPLCQYQIMLLGNRGNQVQETKKACTQ